MSLAAGIQARTQGQGDDGPATCGAVHAEQRSGSLGRACQERRTAAYLEQAPKCAHLLEVLEELRRPVVGSRTRPARIWPCAQNLSQRSRTAVLAKKCRDSAARAASRFGPMLANTFERGLRRGYRKPSDTRVEPAALIAAAASAPFHSNPPAKEDQSPHVAAAATGKPCRGAPCGGLPVEITQLEMRVRALWRHPRGSLTKNRPGIARRPLKSHDLVSPSFAEPLPRLLLPSEVLCR